MLTQRYKLISSRLQVISKKRRRPTLRYKRISSSLKVIKGKYCPLSYFKVVLRIKYYYIFTDKLKDKCADNVKTWTKRVRFSCRYKITMKKKMDNNTHVTFIPEQQILLNDCPISLQSILLLLENKSTCNFNHRIYLLDIS